MDPNAPQNQPPQPQEPPNQPTARLSSEPTEQLVQPQPPLGTPHSPQPYPSEPPGANSKSNKKLSVIFIVVILLFGTTIGIWYFTRNKTTGPVSDKQGIQNAVDKYCQQLGEDTGLKDIDSGYIISDRFSEEETGDDFGLLRFKQVGDAAIATVDCERGQSGPIGAGASLLFIKDGGVWDYKDAFQYSAPEGFLCSILEEYSVPTELVAECSSEPQQHTQPR